MGKREIAKLERREKELEKELKVFFRKHKNPVKATIVGLATGMSNKAEELSDIKAELRNLKKVM